MPLISHGSFDAWRGFARGPAQTEYGVTGAQPFSVLREVTRALQPVPVRFERSPKPVEVSIADVSLTEGSRSMLREVLTPSAPVRVLAWCWDLSGAPPSVLPQAEPKRWRMELSDGRRRLVAGELPVWHGPLVGGLAVRVILWQGGDEERVPAEVAEAMRHSRLASVLGMLASTSDTTVTSAVMVREAAAGLGGEIAPVLRALCPDYVDLFEGFLPATPLEDGLVLSGYHANLRLRG